MTFLAASFALVVTACSSAAPPSTDTSGTSPSTDSSETAIKADLPAASAALVAIGYDQIANSVDTVAPAPATLADGSTFTLADSIATKVKSGDPLNYVLSYQSTGIALFSEQYKAGYDATTPIAQSLINTNSTAIAPVPAIDIPAQIAQIEALLNTDQIDCLAIEPPDGNAFTDITNKVIAKGIPVFTAGVQSNGNEFSNFTQVPLEEGKTAAETVLKWMDTSGNDLKVFSMGGGDPSAEWAQGRFQGFEQTIMAAIPDAKFINGANNPLTVDYDPAASYDTYKALLTGQPDLQFILNVDIGAENADRAVTDAGVDGKVFTAGWNTSAGQLDAIEAGIQVAAFDQGWSQQAGFGAVACAVYLATGEVMPNTQHLIPVTADGVDAARKLLGG
jgi:ribose transport system substrate-binding protein